MSTTQENLENQVTKRPYEQPMLKNFGDMKDITLSSAGTGADFNFPGNPDGSADDGGAS